MNLPLFIRKFKALPRKDRLKILGKIGLVLGGTFFILVLAIFIYVAKDLPSPGKINKRFVIESTKIYDRTGEHLLYEVHGEEKRTLVSSGDIADSVKYATIVLEDQDFYSHHGIKLSSIVRAALKDILKRSVAQGGSTITQQFVKNSLLSPERTLSRKIKEVVLSLEIEQKFSKDEILEMYLNEIPYGSNAYGVEAAARTFFGKSAKELTLDEGALLASLPKAPSFYSPFGSHLESLKMRQEFALDSMAKSGYITETQAGEAKTTDVFAKIAPFQEKMAAPHFVMYVKEYLEKNYGQQEVEQGGLKVYTTLDWDKQQIAEKAVREGVEKNSKSWNSFNAALVAADPKTGQVLAMVGSKDYFGKSEPEGCLSGKNCKFEPQDNVAIRDRQPGSSFKPYVYLTAFKKGYTPETLLFDVETNFSTDSGKDYTPQNYDGKFRGPLKMKESLGMSLNIPAVQTLYLAGLKESIMTAKSLGITGLNYPDRYGLSLVLGGGEVKLVDHVSAFGALANGGVRQEKETILKIEDSKGKILEEFKSISGQRIIEEKYVAMLDHIISTNDYRAPVFGEKSPLRFDNRPVAVKTGTTNEFRDGWTVGFTPSIAVGVWAGNNDNSPMRAGADGVNVAAPIWRSFLDQVLGNYAVEQFPKYEKEETGKAILDGKLEIKEDVEVCEIPGDKGKYCLVSEFCPKDKIKKKDFANIHTILWYVKKSDPRGDMPSRPQDDPQFKNWEKGVQNWLGRKMDKFIAGAPPEELCQASQFSSYLPKVSLSVSKDVPGLTISLSANVDAPYGTKSIGFYVNGDKISSDGSKATFPVALDKVGSDFSIEVRVVDENDNSVNDSEDITF